MILIWSRASDTPSARLYAALCGRGVPVVFVDQSVVDTPPCRLEIVTAAFIRPYQCDGSSRDRELWTWADETDRPVVNRPRAMGLCSSKPHQLPRLEAAGFYVPETLVTTDPDAAADFWNRHAEVVYKSISSTRSVVSLLSERDRSRIDDVRCCPVQFQQYVDGTDYRVHVVGDAVVAARIETTAVDYRYASREGARVEIVPAPVPAECASRCVALARAFGLVVAGIDLRVTTDDKWFCFEVNPSPAFTYYDDDGRVTDLIANLLVRLAQTA